MGRKRMAPISSLLTACPTPLSGIMGPGARPGRQSGLSREHSVSPRIAAPATTTERCDDGGESLHYPKALVPPQTTTACS